MTNSILDVHKTFVKVCLAILQQTRSSFLYIWRPEAIPASSTLYCQN